MGWRGLHPADVQRGLPLVGMSMRYYPLFLDLSGRHCVVAGLGEVGRRKALGLLPAGPASLLLLDPAPPPPEFAQTIAPLQATGQVVYASRAFAEADLNGASLVFAATGSPEENQRIARACAGRRILCNVIDAPRTGDCIVPSIAEADGLMAAFSTQGQSPALAKVVKHELQRALQQWSSLACFLGVLRPRLLALGLASSENAAVFRALVCPELAAALEKGDMPEAKALAASRLPEALQAAVDDMLHAAMTHEGDGCSL